MTAFLKIDRCADCRRDLPWEWVPPVDVGGKTLAGTGVWRSLLVNKLCPGCAEAREANSAKIIRAHTKRERLIALLGGLTPFRAFTFERFQVTAGNTVALDSAVRFDPNSQNLYLWGGCGVGKTHLAYAIARRAFWMGRHVVLTTPARLIRALRMKAPEDEQRIIDAATAADVLVLDGFGDGGDTTFARLVLHEVLDGRAYSGRFGLVVTSRFSPGQFLRRSREDGVASRLIQMCEVVNLRGDDGRLRRVTNG